MEQGHVRSAQVCVPTQVRTRQECPLSTVCKKWHVPQRKRLQRPAREERDFLLTLCKMHPVSQDINQSVAIEARCRKPGLTHKHYEATR